MPPIRDMLAATGITEQQWRVLRVLAEYGSQDTSTLADRACLLFPSLTRIAQTMSRKGLISLYRDDIDRRRQIITITEAGQQVIDNNIENAEQIVQGFKNTLGEVNYEQLLDLLAMLSPSREQDFGEDSGSDP